MLGGLRVGVGLVLGFGLELGSEFDLIRIGVGFGVRVTLYLSAKLSMSAVVTFGKRSRKYEYL